MWLYSKNLLTECKNAFFPLCCLLDCTCHNSSWVCVPVSTKEASEICEKDKLLLSAVQKSHCGWAEALLLQPLVGVFLWAFLSIFVVALDSSDFPRRNMKQIIFYMH